MSIATKTEDGLPPPEAEVVSLAPEATDKKAVYHKHYALFSWADAEGIQRHIAGSIWLNDTGNQPIWWRPDYDNGRASEIKSPEIARRILGKSECTCGICVKAREIGALKFPVSEPPAQTGGGFQ